MRISLSTEDPAHRSKCQENNNMRGDERSPFPHPGGFYNDNVKKTHVRCNGATTII